jgi:hypothetical protein
VRCYIPLLLATVVSVAGCATMRHDCCPPVPIICPKCQHHCTLVIEKVKEKRVCYDVECEPICIPKPKLPWEDCCAPPQCARTRLVHVLVEKEYECERCGCKWTPVCCEGCKAASQE